MHVSFALFEDNTLLHRGEFLVGQRPGFVVYGEHHHVALSTTHAFVHRPEFQLFSGLVVEHSFELPASPISLRYYTIEHEQQEQRFNAALRVGVHASEDWETLQLAGYTFAFRCAPRP